VGGSGLQLVCGSGLQLVGGSGLQTAIPRSNADRGLETAPTDKKKKGTVLPREDSKRP